MIILLILQLSVEPACPPPKPIDLPEKMPAMFAREIEIEEEVKQRDADKIKIFTLKPQIETDISELDVVAMRERRNFKYQQRARLLRVMYTSPQYNRRGIRNH